MKLLYALCLAGALLAAEAPAKKESDKVKFTEPEKPSKAITLSQVQLLTLENIDLKIRLLTADLQKFQKDRMDMLTGICKDAGFSISECGIDVQAGTVVKREPEKKRITK